MEVLTLEPEEPEEVEEPKPASPKSQPYESTDAKVDAFMAEAGR